MDCVARARQLDDAVKHLDSGAFRPDHVSAMTVLGAARNQATKGDLHVLKIAQDMFQRIQKLAAEESGAGPSVAENTVSSCLPSAFVLMRQTLACCGLQEEADALERGRLNRGLHKRRGVSSIVSARGRLQTFGAHETDHPDMVEIKRLMDEEWTPYLRSKGCGDERDPTCSHAEKLALAYGYLESIGRLTGGRVAVTGAGAGARVPMQPAVDDGACVCVVGSRSGAVHSPIVLTKNLRMCKDCHDATCLLSSLLQRVIMVRDANTWHRFENGECSCGNHW
jgi:hypothetical protein